MIESWNFNGAKWRNLFSLEKSLDCKEKLLEFASEQEENKEKRRQLEEEKEEKRRQLEEEREEKRRQLEEEREASET